MPVIIFTEPTAAPTNFTVVDVTDSTSALLAWNPVSPDSVRGHMKVRSLIT